MERNWVLPLLWLLMLTSVVQNECSIEIPDAEVQETEISGGYFKIPQQVIKDEIYRRTTQGNVCDGDIQDILMKDETEWSISIDVGYVSRLYENANSDPFPYVAMKISGEQVTLGLGYFTTKLIQENSHGYVVDNITWSDGTITVKRGDDHLVMQIELDKDCGEELLGKAANNQSLSILESWYPHNKHIFNCGIHGWPKSVCDHVTENMCEIQRADNDICLKDTYEGCWCGLGMKIMTITGIFRDKSLMTSKTPMKSAMGYRFNGLRHMGFVYPCLYQDH